MMKQTLFLSLSFLFLVFTSCDNGKWWGDRKIADIVISGKKHIEMIKFEYDDEGRLSHYSSKEISSRANNDLSVYYDVDIEYTDTTVVVKGWMPYVTFEKHGYANGVTVYILDESKFAKKATTSYDLVLDSISGEKYVTYSSFTYNKNMMLKDMFVGGQEAKHYSYKDNSIFYEITDNQRAIIISSSTFIEHTDILNKSCLALAPLNRDLQQHEPAFYARLLGRPSKHLVSMEATTDDYHRVQFTENYTYTIDGQGYVKSYVCSKKSSVQLASIDPFSEQSTSVITYVD